jgi:hypothetical protein
VGRGEDGKGKENVRMQKPPLKPVYKSPEKREKSPNLDLEKLSPEELLTNLNN